MEDRVTEKLVIRGRTHVIKEMEQFHIYISLKPKVKWQNSLMQCLFDGHLTSRSMGVYFVNEDDPRDHERSMATFEH